MSHFGLARVLTGCPTPPVPQREARDEGQMAVQVGSVKSPLSARPQAECGSGIRRELEEEIAIDGAIPQVLQEVVEVLVEDGFVAGIIQQDPAGMGATQASAGTISTSRLMAKIWGSSIRPSSKSSSG